MVTAIIMASGFSKRMGTNKLLLPLSGKPVIQHTIDLVSQGHFKNRILVSSDKTILGLGRQSGLTVLENFKADLGQCESIKLGVNHARNSLGYAFFPGDQPLLDLETVNRLLACFYKNPDKLIVPRFNNQWGSPTIFSSRFYSDLMKLQGDTGGKPILKEYQKEIIFVDVSDELVLKDIDTRADYEMIRNCLEGK